MSVLVRLGTVEVATQSVPWYSIFSSNTTPFLRSASAFWILPSTEGNIKPFEDGEKDTKGSISIE